MIYLINIQRERDNAKMKQELLNLASEVEEEIKDIIKKIDEDAMYNSMKVLNAFHKNNVSEMHFNSTTGYGYNDIRKRSNRKNICRSIRCRR